MNRLFPPCYVHALSTFTFASGGILWLPTATNKTPGLKQSSKPTRGTTHSKRKLPRVLPKIAKGTNGSTRDLSKSEILLRKELKFESLDALVAAIEEDKEFLLLHGGDAFTGTLFFTKFQGQLNAEYMNYFEFDAMAIGNHEFDRGNQVLADFSDLINFPLLSANVKVSGDDPMAEKYLPLTINLLDEHPVAIVGLTTEYTELISSPSDNTKFIEVAKAAKTVVNILKTTGIF